jgi:DNA repair protein RecN (Recombination protein N)
VLVVTHLPAVAAVADTQIAVSKQVTGQSTSATARGVEGTERVDEIARMLSGDRGGAVAREHAEELLRTAFERVAMDGPGSLISRT